MDEIPNDQDEPYSLVHFNVLKELLPDADVDFIKAKCQRYFEETPRLHRFIGKILRTKDYPKKTDTESEKAREKEKQLYTKDIDVKKFLEIFPEPEQRFKQSQLNVTKNSDDFSYAFTFLKNKFSSIYVNTIREILVEQKSVYKAAKVLEKLPPELRSKRRTQIYSTDTNNLALLQEIAYVKLEADIAQYKNAQIQARKEKIELFRNLNELVQCQCCYEDEVLPEETATCENGHQFCNNCINKACELAYSEGRVEFVCLFNCTAQFTLQSLEKALSGNLYKRICQRIQALEVRAAKMEDVEFCPFCDFASIPSENDKIFKCLNPECLKQTCRLCRKEAHIPLRCEELPTDEQIQIRKQIEDRLTEALVRVCYKCGKKFIKEGGCNKMKCSCGATMCYICNKPVENYTHFNGEGGTKYNLCPLFSNTEEEHARRVLRETRKMSIESSTYKNEKISGEILDDVKHFYKKKLKSHKRRTH